MPIYEYECTRCGHEFEEERAMSAPPRQRCPLCRGRVQKLVSQPAILFKGSGFYATDSRRQAGNGKRPSKEGGGPAAETGSTDAAVAGKSSEPTADKPGKAEKAEKPAAKRSEKKVV